MVDDLTVPQSSVPSEPSVKPAPSTTPQQSSKRSVINYLLLAVCLIIGVVMGYFLYKYLPGNAETTQPKQVVKEVPTNITLPQDAVQIQSCADKKGTLYIKPSDIPVGPVYMVHDNKVIGIEYMLSKEEFLSGKNYKDLVGAGMKVDHVNIGLLSQGHEGYPTPHYHVDLYTVPKAESEAIKCQTTTQSTATPSASVNPTAKASTNSAVKR